MTRKELPARAENILRSASSPTACTKATVESLRSFLTVPESHIDSQSQQTESTAKTERGRKFATKAAPARPARRRAKKQPAVSVLEIKNEENDGASMQDRLVLATEIANVALKALTEAIKRPPTTTKRTSLARSSSKTSLSNGLSSRSQTPLQPICVNRVIDSPAKQRHARRSSSTSTNKDTIVGVRAQAECAHIAYASLRSLQGIKGFPALPTLQLESGMLALITKLVALGLDDLAMKELRILHRRLESSRLTSTEKSATTNGESNGDDKTASKGEALADMLKFQNIDVPGPQLQLMISSQMQVLKLIASSNQINVVEHVICHVSLDASCSPANLILRQMDSGAPDSRTKAARQMDSLSQILLNLSSHSASSLTRNSMWPTKDISSEISFQLQVIALKIRSIWWKLVEHQGNVVSEMIDPFSKYLAAFHRRSKQETRTKFDIARNAYEELSGVVRDVPGFREAMFLTVFQSLADLAQDNLDYSAASQWIDKCRKIAESRKTSKSQLCLLACRSAIAHIRALHSFSEAEIVKSVLDAVAALSGDLQGESADLDELLIMVASLRKSAFLIVQDCYRSGKWNVSSLKGHCSTTVLICLRYMIRYVGSTSRSGDSEKAIERHKERLSSTLQLAYSAVESVAALARFSSSETQEKWSIVEAGLRDCCELLSRLDSVNNGLATEDLRDRPDATCYVSISNAYWFRYIRLKQGAVDTKRMRDCLWTSIDLLKDRPRGEKHVGCLSIKYERFGQLCENDQNYTKAAKAYKDALEIFCESGALQMAANFAASRALCEIFSNETDLIPLSRVLLMHLKAKLKASPDGQNSDLPYDPKDCCITERGVLLEQQINLLSSLMIEAGLSGKHSIVLEETFQRTLSLYSRSTFPVRRLRVVVRLLSLHLDCPKRAGDDSQIELSEDEEEQGIVHYDQCLMQFLPQLSASHQALLALHKSPLALQDIENALHSWSRLAHTCSDWGQLQRKVSDVSEWIVQLERVAKYLDMQGLGQVRLLALSILVLIHEMEPETRYSTLIVDLSLLGVQYLRLGYSARAGHALHKAQRYLDLADIAPLSKVRWHLSYCEFSLLIGNLETCKENLTKAREVFSMPSALKPGKSHSGALKDQLRFIADAHFLQSLLAQAEGKTSEALYHARLSAKSCQRAWSILDRNLSKDSRESPNKVEGTQRDSLAESLSLMSVSEPQKVDGSQAQRSRNQAAGFWDFVPRLFRGFMHISLLYSNCGLSTEAHYYLGQVKRISRAAHAPSLIAQSMTLKAQHAVCSGQLENGIDLLNQAAKVLSGLPQDAGRVMLLLSQAQYYTKNGTIQAAEKACALAEELVRHLSKHSFVEGLTKTQAAIEGLEFEMQRLQIKKSKSTQQIASRKAPTKSTSSAVLTEASASIEAVGLSQLQNQILLRRVRTMISERRFEQSAALLERSDKHICNQKSKVVKALLFSKALLGQGLEQMIGDPVFSVIPESTISCPSVKGLENRRHGQSVSEILQAKPTVDGSKNAGVRRTAKRLSPKSAILDGQIEASSLELAQRELITVLKSARQTSSTTTLHEISDVLTKVLVMLSATSYSATRPSGGALLLAYTMELSKRLAFSLESAAIRTERCISQMSNTHEWPREVDAYDQSRLTQEQAIDHTDFQTQYVDIIPESWMALSISLNESRKDLLISKMRSGQTPFILRLPLHRGNSLDSDEESFSFDDGKVELQDIIRLANESTHSGQDMSRKGAKTRWWDARKALDARMKDLLNNIQAIWLGGFRGIFSQIVQNPALLSRFQQSLQRILGRHLPSRQRSAKGLQPSPITLDPRVLELFVGLGMPSESNDVDEALSDLLYFVVDILQFNGERNAYDEVDFDSITIETIDALKQYHQAAESDITSALTQHTILILDKSLHTFPWESLPCMNGQAISRLPSIGCLRDRILKQREHFKERGNPLCGREGFEVSRQGGAWVLNPAGDLKSTQEKLEEPLQGLSGWSSIVNQEPSEAEMKSCLAEHDLFLYFGHGSGRQYIRDRAIKRLDKCAVALLMGCSSGALTEAGEFEPYGTPMSYMQAGCPALLATLWDVTDKDIDRFSYTVLEQWGLFSEAQPQSSPAKKRAKQRGKYKARVADNVNCDMGSKASLDKAVAKGRDSCIMRYLNGAAPVVYGVPVYLS